MSLDDNLNKAFKVLGKAPIIVFSCTVVSIDESKKTIVAKDVDELEFTDIRLSAAEDDKNSLLIIPKVDSSVLVAQIGNNLNTLFVVSVNEVEKVLGVVKELDVEDETGFKLHLKDGELKINGDQFGGLVKAPELKTQVDKNTAILRAIQQAVQSWNPVPEDGGSAFKGLISSITGMQRADLGSIQNTKIKHG